MGNELARFEKASSCQQFLEVANRFFIIEQMSFDPDALSSIPTSSFRGVSVPLRVDGSFHDAYNICERFTETERMS